MEVLNPFWGRFAFLEPVVQRGAIPDMPGNGFQRVGKEAFSEKGFPESVVGKRAAQNGGGSSDRGFGTIVEYVVVDWKPRPSRLAVKGNDSLDGSIDDIRNDAISAFKPFKGVGSCSP